MLSVFKNPKVITLILTQYFSNTSNADILLRFANYMLF
jgi:hypothetical protein